MMKSIALIGLALALAFAAPAQAATHNKVLDIEPLVSPAGVQAWLVHDATVPVISIHFSFDGGLIYDPDGKTGTARLVSIMLDEGAGDLDSQSFQKQLSDNAIDMGFTPGRDAFYGELRTLSKNKDLAFKLLHMALTQPRFDADALTRMKNANVAEIKQDMGDPDWLAARTFNATAFAGHFYARPGYGTLESMRAITQQDLHRYVKEQFARNVLKVAIAGDITREDAARALDSIFGSLPKTAKAAPDKKVALSSVGKTVLLPFDTPQTVIIAAEQGIARHDPDWYAAVVMNYILGGSAFDARLGREIRDKRGLTYGVYSGLSNMRDADLIQANMSCSNDKAGEALNILRREWAKMGAHGATDDELKNAKAYLTGSLLLSLTSTDSIASVMNDMQRDGLSPDDINLRNARIQKVSAQDVRRVAARLLKPENLTVILVGKPAGITADVMLDTPPGMDEAGKQGTLEP